MSDAFEARAWDAAGRTGELRVPSGTTVRTPALLPVVNPRRITVDPARFPEFGAEALITNAYIVHSDDDLRERAREQGLHDMLGFDGAIMTDSGSFQLAEYGEIDVTTPEILQFQREIGSDIGTPVDVPTPPDADRERAAADVETTTDRLREAERVDTGEMLVTAPVQGATSPDLREAAARDAAATDLDVFPVGGVVPLLNAYRFDAVVEVTLAAKRELPPDAPVHLFGAGHPVTFALAAAAGCDLFDSAAYAVYARDGRYLTPRGTRHLQDLGAFPCACPICTEHEPADLRRRDDAERERLLAEHNLYASFAEMRRVRQAIQAGTLLELVETRARAHPRMLDGYRALLDGVDQLDARDPASKATFFYVSPESARRPEVARHHARLDRVADRASGDVLLVEPTATHDAPSAKFDAGGLAPSAGGARWSHGAESGGADDGGSNPGVRPSTAAAHEAAARAADRGGPDPETFDAVWLVRPPFGPFPGELAATYPLSAELPDEMDPAGQERAARGVARLAELTDAALTLVHRGWADAALAALPDGVTAVDVAPDADEMDSDGADSSGGEDA